MSEWPSNTAKRPTSLPSSRRRPPPPPATSAAATPLLVGPFARGLPQLPLRRHAAAAGGVGGRLRRNEDEEGEPSGDRESEITCGAHHIYFLADMWAPPFLDYFFYVADMWAHDFYYFSKI